MPAPEIVLAYAGPGADLGFLTYALALLGWAVACFSALVLWPIRSLLRQLRGEKKAATPPGEGEVRPQVFEK